MFLLSAPSKTIFSFGTLSHVPLCVWSLPWKQATRESIQRGEFSVMRYLLPIRPPLGLRRCFLLHFSL